MPSPNRPFRHLRQLFVVLALWLTIAGIAQQNRYDEFARAGKESTARVTKDTVPSAVLVRQMSIALRDSKDSLATLRIAFDLSVRICDSIAQQRERELISVLVQRDTCNDRLERTEDKLVECTQRLRECESKNDSLERVILARNDSIAKLWIMISDLRVRMDSLDSLGTLRALQFVVRAKHRSLFKGQLDYTITLTDQDNLIPRRILRHARNEIRIEPTIPDSLNSYILSYEIWKDETTYPASKTMRMAKTMSLNSSMGVSEKRLDLRTFALDASKGKQVARFRRRFYYTLFFNIKRDISTNTTPVADPTVARSIKFRVR
jgi:hypothetical protein